MIMIMIVMTKLTRVDLFSTGTAINNEGTVMAVGGKYFSLNGSFIFIFFQLIFFLHDNSITINYKSKEII